MYDGEKRVEVGKYANTQSEKGLSRKQILLVNQILDSTHIEHQALPNC